MCRAIVFFLLAQGFFHIQCLSLDGSLRSHLNHFTKTRNDDVNPTEKTKSRDYVIKTFKDLGLETWTEEFPSNQPQYPGINVVGRVKGAKTGTDSDKILIIGSHYDTVKTTNGVDDNGSGITALLQIAQHYQSSNNAKCTQDYTLLFVAFDLEEYSGGCPVNKSQCSCPKGLCGSYHFVKNLTSHLNGSSTTVQGAFVLETIMNYNTSEKSQELPSVVQVFLPNIYKQVQDNKFRGDFLAVIGRKSDDNSLLDGIVGNWGDKGKFKVTGVQLIFNGKPSDLDQQKKDAMRHFFRSDHRSFWNSPKSWPALFITDTADFRGHMKTCYHQLCDNMASVTPDMISFMGKTVTSLALSAHNMTKRDCSKQEQFCKEEQVIKSNQETIVSPRYPSEYVNGVTCSWTKESEYPQSLKFDSFDVEDSVNCSSGDYLEVIAGGKELGRYCGSSIPKTITTKEKKLTVRFVTDDYVSKKGFKITWTTNAPPVSMATRCHGFLSKLLGVVAVFPLLSLSLSLVDAV